jgi:omega-amidase
MKFSLIQSDILWEKSRENLQRYTDKILKLTDSDVILLPEMFSTGFSMKPDLLYETMGGPTHNWMQKMADYTKALIGGSLIIHDDYFFNRFLCVHPDGTTTHYDKRHLFRMGLENENYAWGNERVIVEFGGWRFLMITCYDLRFPVWCRCRNDYDAILLTANWPEARRDVWLKLIAARAIENQCYVFAVNRTGTDGNEISYCGDSLVCDFKGNFVAGPVTGIETILEYQADISELNEFRAKFPAWMDADEFILMENPERLEDDSTF